MATVSVTVRFVDAAGVNMAWAQLGDKLPQTLAKFGAKFTSHFLEPSLAIFR